MSQSLEKELVFILKLKTHEEKEFEKEQREIALMNIEKLTEELKHPLLGMETKIVKNAALRRNYALIDDTQGEIACCKEIIKVFKTNALRYRQLAPRRKATMLNHYHQAHLVLARHRFHYFLLCMEWDSSPENKFYDNRFVVFKEWASELENLEFGKYDLLGLSAPPRSGKAQPLYSKILTPNGWDVMGNIKAGSYVIGADGKPCKVLEVFPQGKKDIYRVWFGDGTHADCSGDHLWTVQLHNGRWITLETLEIQYFLKHRTFAIGKIRPIHGKYENTGDRVNIREIKKVGREECQCILVDHQQHLYVTDGYNLTHNTGIGTLFLLWVMSRHPDKSCFFVSHTTAMAKKVYDDLLKMIGVNDKKQGISNYFQIFPEMQVEKSAEYLWIDLSPKGRDNVYKTFYARGIDGNMAGVLEASHLLYCDDLISGIEEALNPSRLETAWTKYTTDITQRRKDSTVKELHIATRWSTKDVLSQLEDVNEDNERAKFIKVPGLDEEGKSNFNFKYNPLDEKHFNHLKNLWDEVSFECIVQQNPVERDGLIFTKDSLNFYEGELPGEPDQVVAACDVAWGGGDYLSMPIGYVYEASKEVYIHDVVHSPGTKDITKPLVVNKIIEHKVTRDHFEANNGGDEYAEDIGRRLKEHNYRCAITHKKAPPNRTKLDRIVECAPEIKGTITDNSGYKLYFLSAKARKGNKQYEMYMKHLMNFNQGAKFIGKQKDDAADATASLVTNTLSGGRTGRLETYSGKLLGL